MQIPRLALVWLICAGGVSLRALPEPRAQTAPQDDVEAARQVLRGDTDSATDLRKAVRVLVDAGEFGVLGEELRTLARTPVRVVIIEEMLLEPGHCLRILEDVLPFLASDEEVLRDKATEYVQEVHLGAATSADFSARLASLLVGEAVTESVLRGAVITSGIVPALDWVPALLSRWEQDPAGVCVPDIHQSLRRITMEDLAADLAAWQEWHASNRFSTREELLEDKLRREMSENAALRRQVIQGKIQRLEKAKANILAENLGADEAEVRVFVAERLWEKAKASNGDRDDTLDSAKEPIRQQLVHLLETKARGPELRALAGTHALLQAGEAEARDLLLRIFQALDGNALGRRQLLDALTTVTAGKPDPLVADALHGFLDQAAAPEVRRAIWQALGQVGEEATLVRVRAVMEVAAGTPAPEQEAALEAALQIARQAGEGAVSAEVYQDLCGYLERESGGDAPQAVALGLAELSGLVAVEARNQAFVLLQGVLQSNLADKTRVARYSDSLIHLVGLERRAVVVLTDLLKEQAGVPDSVAVEPLLRRLNDLAARVEPRDMKPALVALVAFLPEGGRSATPQTQPARFASQALHEIERQHDDADLGDELRRALTDLCEAGGRPGWAADFLRDVLLQEPGPVEPERSQLVWRRAQALMQTLKQAATSEGRAREAWDFLAPLDATTDVARRERILGALVDAAERVRDLAAPGAAAGGRLLDLWTAEHPTRGALAQRVARLLVQDGQRKQAHDLIGRELGDASSPSLDILRARASRHDDTSPEVVASALDRYQALLGTAERPGPVDAGHAEFAELLVDLAELWMLSDLKEQARTSLQRLPGEDQLDPVLVAKVQEIRTRLDGDGS